MNCIMSVHKLSCWNNSAVFWEKLSVKLNAALKHKSLRALIQSIPHRANCCCCGLRESAALRRVCAVRLVWQHCGKTGWLGTGGRKERKRQMRKVKRPSFSSGWERVTR